MWAEDLPGFHFFRGWTSMPSLSGDSHASQRESGAQTSKRARVLRDGLPARATHETRLPWLTPCGRENTEIKLPRHASILFGLRVC